MKTLLHPPTLFFLKRTLRQRLKVKQGEMLCWMALLTAPAIDMLINARNSAGGLSSPKYMENMHKVMAVFQRFTGVFSGGQQTNQEQRDLEILSLVFLPQIPLKPSCLAQCPPLALSLFPSLDNKICLNFGVS